MLTSGCRLANDVIDMGGKMRSNGHIRKEKAARAVVSVCAMCLGVVLLTAGSGKLLGGGGFAHALQGSFLPPTMAGVVGRYLPWSETGLGLMLVFGILPAVVSALSAVLTLGFIASNSWALAGGGVSIRCGDCFGFWERFVGSPSALEALMIDIMLLGLAVVVLTWHRHLISPIRFLGKSWKAGVP